MFYPKRAGWELKLLNNQKILGVRGKKVGAFKATIVDKITKEKVEISITVLNPFTLSPKQLTLTVGQSKEVIIDGNGDYEIPNNAHINLSLSGDKKKLIVKGLQEGDTQVVIKDKKANLSATLSIKVTAAAPSIKEFSLSASQLTLKMNEEKRVILQGNEDYEIGNSQIAQLTLSDDKKTLIVKAVKAGEETIKIKDKKANKELPLHIAVLRPFSINPSTLNIKVGQTQSIAVEGGGRYQISQNSLVEVVSQTEHLITFKGKTVGSGSISIKDERANKTLELTVKVTQALVPFHISPSTIHVKVGETKTVTITGNGKYELSKTSSPYVELTLNQAGTLTIKGKAKGEETLYVRDLNSVSEEKDKNDNKDHDSEDNEEAKNYESRKLTITILPATMEKQFEADGYTLSKWLDMSSEEVDFTQIPALKNIGMIGEGAFKGLTQLKKIVLPSSLEYIDFDAFAHCSSLESVKLQGNNLDEIARGAFSDCRNLRRLDIPSSVRKINGEAFNGCTSLRTIILRHTSVCSLHMAMGYIENLVAIYVPDSLVESYKNDMDWELYKNKIKPISELTNRKTRK
ncbi:leucine-rich repeat domain-containing protein [Capnocytophaga gingivalis]|uniref:leucine-rich repeat domain-containing protein n=1 Tax=Capnocytophaga gingivalis TaxID=1017 RepID=UPI0028F0A168|nr:leucine-rich repeat domain-containing protein [Capnocytophaga gingivalis]